MTEAEQPEALRLIEALEDAIYEWSGYVTADDAPRTLTQHTTPHVKALAEELRRKNTRIAELEQQLVAEAAKTAAEKLRADQMTEQHRMQAAMHAQATERPRQCLHGISEPSGWRDIETAPKDSGYVLLRGRREQDVASGYWLQSAYAGNGAWIWPFVHMTPMLWAPLPPSPSSADEGRDK